MEQIKKKNTIKEEKITESLYERVEKVPVGINRRIGLVAIAALPSAIVSTYIFGPRALVVICLAVFFCTILEYIFNGLTRTKKERFEMSPVVTGMLLAFMLPANLPIFQLFIGCFFAVIIVKKMFGGLGHNVVNPAAAGALFLWFAFPIEMQNYPLPEITTKLVEGAGITPLQYWFAGRVDQLPSAFEQFLGFVTGGLGEVSIVALLIGGIFLMWKRAVNPLVPVVFLATIMLISFLIGADPLFQIVTGPAYLVAFFLMADPATTPISLFGKVIFAFGCGIITIIIRCSGVPMDGALIAVLVMNILTPYINGVEDKKTRNSMDENMSGGLQ